MKKVILFLVVLIALWLIAINKPQWRFRKQVSENNISVNYSDIGDYDAKTLIPEIDSVVKRASIYKEDYKIRVYLTKSAGEFWFFAPLCRGKRFCLNPYANAVYVAPVFSESGTLKFYGWELYDAKIEITKAAVLPLIAQNDSVLGYFFIDDWRKTGYAEYVANEIPRYMNSELCDPKAEPAYKEYENRMCVKVMLEGMKLPVYSMLKDNYLYESVLKEAKMYYCSR